MNTKNLNEQAKEIEPISLNEEDTVSPVLEIENISEEKRASHIPTSFDGDKVFQMMKEIINIKEEFSESCNSIGDNLSIINSYLRDQKNLISEISLSEKGLTEYVKQRVVKVHIADEIIKEINELVKGTIQELRGNCEILERSYAERQAEERRVNEEIIKKSQEAQRKLAYITDKTWKWISAARNLDIMLKVLISYSTAITIILLSLLINILLK